MSSSNPTLERLDDQIAWYDIKSASNQWWYKGLKAVELVAASAIPFAAGFSAPSLLTGMLGVVVVVIEGINGLCQFQHNWITYRSTCEELKHEKFLWLGKAGPYLDIVNPAPVLAERVESLISREHAKWVMVQKPLGKHKSGNNIS